MYLHQREHFYIKGNIVPALEDLLHLPVKFGAVRSVRVIENDDLMLCFGTAKEHGVFKGD